MVGQGGGDLGGLWREEYGGDLDDGEAERRGVGVELDRSMRDGCVVVTLTGQINLFTAPRIQRVLLKDSPSGRMGSSAT